MANKILCKKHPKYLAKRKPSVPCFSCLLIYVMRYQHTKEADHRLGSLNPYAYLLSGIDFEEALSELEIFENKSDSELDLDRIAKNLGAKRKTSRKERKDFEKKFSWPRHPILRPKK